MKKYLLILVCLLFLVGCTKEEVKNIEEPVVEEKFILNKVDENKDYVYFNNYKEVLVEGETYVYKYPVVNIVSEEVDNLNLELKNYVIKSYKNAGIYEGNLNSGTIIDYDTYVTEKYISIVQKYYYYIDGMIGEEESKVYVLSLNSGKLVNNEYLLKDYDLTEKELLDKARDKVVTDDIEFAIMNMKNNGYELYVNNENILCMVYYEITNDEAIRKELVLN